MTLDQVKSARELMDDAPIPQESRILRCTAQQYDDLLQTRETMLTRPFKEEIEVGDV